MEKIIYSILIAMFLIGCDDYRTIYIDRNNTIIEKDYINNFNTFIETEYEIIYIDRNITETIIVDGEVGICTQETFNSEFVGRIVYADGTPYKRGAIKAVGGTWMSQGITDDNGTFKIEVKGDDRFIFSAYSPYGDYIFYNYETPLIAQEYDSGKAYECIYDIDILTCYENNEQRG